MIQNMRIKIKEMTFSLESITAGTVIQTGLRFMTIAMKIFARTKTKRGHFKSHVLEKFMLTKGHKKSMGLYLFLRAFTASDSTCSTPSLSSQPMQASVMLWP